MSFTVESVSTLVVDMPIRRPHGIGLTVLGRQSSVIIRMRTEDGIDGLGEAVVPGGGPEWGGESVESMKASIDAYLTPAITGMPLYGVNDAVDQLARASAGNQFAKAGLEMALWDIAGRRAGCSVRELFGGLRRDRIEVLWSIGANVQDPIEEAQRYVAEGHRAIKLMIGTRQPAADAERVRSVCGCLPDDVLTVVDANGRWDEATARRWLPALADAGVDIAEQLVPAWNLDAMARLTGMTRVWTMADESLRSVFDATAIAQRRCADIVAVKVPKLGGLTAARDVAAIARGAGIRCYGGGTMETSIGTSAAAQLFGTLPDLFGSDLMGPLMLTDDVVTEPVVIRGGALQVPDGPGLGLVIDEDKLHRYARA